jgi:hypothetical protein
VNEQKMNPKKVKPNIVNDNNAAHRCPECPAVFSRIYNRDRHYRRRHINSNCVHQCTLCGGIFASMFHLRRHRKTHRVENGSFVILDKAFRKNCVIYRKTYNEKMETLNGAFEMDKNDMKNILSYEIETKRSIKASIIFHAEFLKPLDSSDFNNPDSYVLCLRTCTSHLCNQQEIQLFLQNARRNAEMRIEDFVERGSGWILDEIIATDIEIGSCASLNGSCDFLSVTNIKDLKTLPIVRREEQCFFEAIAYHYTKSRNKKRLKEFIIKYINLTVQSPVKVSDLAKFERDNPQLDCKLNVVFLEDDDTYPIYVSKNYGATNNINLILYKTQIKNKVVTHYAYINDINKVLMRQYRGKSGKKSYNRSVHCPNCLLNIGSEENARRHLIACKENKAQRIILPEEGEKVRFTKFKAKYPVHYVGFVDFEASQQSPKDKCETCAIRKNDECHHKTVIKSIQNPITYSVLIVDNEDKIVYKNTYSGTDCVEHLIDQLLTVEEKLLGVLDEKKKMEKLTSKQQKELKTATVCHICEKDLLDDRVQDHCHVTSKYLGMFFSYLNMQFFLLLFFYFFIFFHCRHCP